MTQSSYSDVFAISHDREHDEEIRAGDLVRTGPNHFPYFTVVAISNGKAWLRDVLSGDDSLAFISRCRLIAPPMAQAAE